ncbi:hypothetical protein [Haloarchaeobius salinus]|uniref:hypothetical protein n=1 Tax=Haloarchaeobius salinus TaxID=1198298 RepID=UPI00210F07B9|nr:hypothetical protein [Haloarchaeobius salinus]
MNGTLTEPLVDPQIAANWIGGGVAAALLFFVISNIIETFEKRNQQRSVTGIAGTSGLLLALGISPFKSLALDLSQLFVVVPTEFPAWIEVLVAVETALGLVYGFFLMWDSGGRLAIASFVVAFFGGILLVPAPLFGVSLFFLAWLLMEASPAERW